ncbi:MAG TPA: amine dehydrogenase large subunit [Candidatus Binataceae bacterium]|jgi:methylamine dehydrogenase heavy chain|nr:amine dehydrogenase large subunit [Candidatus Binataceae bacterium]
MAKRVGIMVALCTALVARASGAMAQMPPQEQTTVRELAPISPHWVAALSPFAGSIMVTPIVLIDGDTQQVVGNITGGLAAMFAAAPDHKHLYVAETFYSRLVRGERTDVVTIYDTRKLAPVGEIAIPTKRQLAIPDATSMEVTTDGRFLLMLNLTPATSVTAVDLENHKVAGEVQIPGCSEILVLGARQFASVCADGAMLTTQFDDNAKVTSQKRTAKPFFDVEKDPVFQLPAIIGSTAYFVSYHATVYPMDLSASPARAGESWSMLSAADKREGWRPGGWQPVGGWARGHQLFVLMHQGGEWTHQKAGPEVWAYDVNTHKRVERIPLPIASNAIRVSQDDNPLLFAMATKEAAVQVFSALKGRYLGTVREVAQNPYTLFGL